MMETIMKTHNFRQVVKSAARLALLALSVVHISEAQQGTLWYQRW